MPQPVDKTVVNMEMESAKEGLDRKKWLDKIHRAAPDVSWKDVEFQNNIRRYKSNLNTLQKDNTVNIADGLIIAEWNEKGSNNLSGSITITDYDSRTNQLYAIGAGGSLWQYTFDTEAWALINDKIRFDNRFLTVGQLDENTSLLLCSVNGQPHYSVSGLEWTASTGTKASSSIRTKNLRSLNNGEHVFYLSDEGQNQNIILYHSQDFGQSFNALASFNTSDLNNVSIDVEPSTGQLVLIEQVTATKSNIFSWTIADQEFERIYTNSDISFGSGGRANIRIRAGELGSPMLFAYDEDNTYWQSINMGDQWMSLGSLPVTPWEDGVFVSYQNPQIMILSEVEAHISRNGGLSWTKINEWHEYYQDPKKFLHADMMYIDEYKDQSGSFISISNHGGINISRDNYLSNKSIAQYGLNISQYYSVRTYPADNNYLFAGSQDQGIQRAYDFDEGDLNFTQLFSGDYGHICFTNLGKSMWTVYPGGWVFYWDNPVTSNYATNNYELNSQDETVWLPPMINSPYDFNGVLLAGGDKDGGPGSHIIELTVNDLGVMELDQWPFDFTVSGGTVTGMASNKFFSNIVYAITSNGKFYRSTNRGANFDDLSHSLNSAHYLYGHEVLPSSVNAGHIYIAGSGYSNSPVFKSEDGGVNFESIQYNLPSTTVFDIAQDPEGLYLFAATESGPYVYIEHLNEWFDLAQGIAPDQTYWTVEYLHNQNKVRFGTYGRGVWDLDIGFLSADEDVVQGTVKLYPNPAQDLLNIELDDSNIHSVSILSASGTQMMQTPANEQLKNIDISAYPNGIYYVIFATKENSIVSKKFIKI